MSLLSLSDIRVRYGSVEVLHGINLHVEEGEIVTILGANGAGKSTTLLTISALFFGAGDAWLAALILTGCVLLGVGATMGASFALGKTVLRGAPSHFTLELPPFRSPQIGKVIVRALKDRSLYVLGRAAGVAAPAGLLLWLLGNIRLAGMPLLALLAQSLDPIGAQLGMDGAILLAFLLSFPANELLLPVCVMILSSGMSLAQAQTAELAPYLLQSGWTQKTAICVMVFTLFHWPCSTTVLTVKKESGSGKWAFISVLLPSVIGVLACAILNQIL